MRRTFTKDSHRGRIVARMENAALRHLLVPVDGSPSATAAVRLALDLAAPDGSVVFAHAIDRATVIAECVTPFGGDPTIALDALESDERDIFAEATAMARVTGVTPTTVSLDGRAADRIAGWVHSNPIDAIVMGTHGHRGVARLVLGSTAAGVLQQAGIPVFVVPERDEVAAPLRPLRTVLVALDASEPAAAAARFAVDLAQRKQARVIFAHVASDAGVADPSSALAQARGYAAERAVGDDSVVLHGAPAEALRIAAEATHADLVAIGTHARRGMARLRLGSVAEEVVAGSPIPVVVIPAARTLAEPVPESAAATTA